jgi:hypothetical protein
MQHPFLEDLSNKTLDELQEAINKLSNNINFASRMGRYEVVGQIQMILEGYRAEVAKRFDEMYKKQNLNNRINVTKDSP